MGNINRMNTCKEYSKGENMGKVKIFEIVKKQKCLKDCNLTSTLGYCKGTDVSS